MGLKHKCRGGCGASVRHGGYCVKCSEIERAKNATIQIPTSNTPATIIKGDE